MRKQALFLLAALVFLVTACGGRPGASPSASSAAPGDIIMPNGPLPQTAYEPPSPPPRRYAEITHTLIPRDDYGRIWPYVGGYIVQWWISGDLIGLCDAAGRVICDPVYNRAEILEKDGKRLYKLTENLMDAGKDVSRVTLAALDGSWAHTYEAVVYKLTGREFMAGEAFSWRPALTCDYITVCEKGKWGVIDYSGAEVLPCVYNEPVCFSEGLAAVTADDLESYSFIDVTGTVILGPYASPPQQKDEWDFTGAVFPRNHGMIFSEGRARFYDSGKYGVIDKSGRIVVPAQFDFITAFSHGTAMTVVKEAETNKRGLISATGRVLLKPADHWLSQTADGKVILDSAQGPVVFDTTSGKQTPWVNTDPMAVSVMSGNGSVVITFGEGESLSFSDALYAVPLDNGNIALSNDGTWQIVNRKGVRIAGPYDGFAESYNNGLILIRTGMSEMTDGTDNALRTLYDRDGNRILPDVYREIIPFDGRYLVRQDHNAGLVDEKGNWVIKTPIYDYLND